MKKLFIVAAFAGIITGCLEKGDNIEPAPQNQLLDNLPINDRDLLLAPLESALDDVKAAIQSDDSYFEGAADWNEGNVKGQMTFKLDGPDTIMVQVEILGNANVVERHSWFYDQKHRLFFSGHEITNADFGFEHGPMHRNYKFYFEDNGEKLSTYAKISFDGAPLPEIWTPVCLTREEESHLQGRLNSCRLACRVEVLD
jgi:hypothetical protein